MSIAAALAGCSRIHPQKQEKVWVVARQTYLHDRVAAVSNRVGQVTNGEQLEVLEHGRRFLKVKTPKNEIGWIEQHAVIDQDDYDQFAKLAAEHKNDPVVASAVLRDDVYLHSAPGRDTQRFFLLPGNAKVQLLIRASVEKLPPGAHRPAPKPDATANAAAGQPTSEKPAAPPPSPAVPKLAQPKTAAPAVPAAPAPPPVMEDWWLVKDASGNYGWVLSGRMDVDVPDSVAQYAEGQRIVGAYVLTTVHDENSDLPNHEVPEYVMLLEPMKYGLPFDYDQVRVFTWSRNHHRYETAFRLRPIQGFLPVNVTKIPGPTKDGAMVPAFGVKIAADSDVSIDPQTGVARPANLRTINFVLLDTVVRRVGPDMAPIPAMHSADEKKKDAKKVAAKKRK
ncbi:SH3 domain-containing protein [Occallatibacter riparius]|uniref:SH3 domain-containing protein n=1 Tax=Occallatibacter riparius TaxID=1002689 RepID=A0A9J7BHS5_9BACT|nr:SH3 domain-containing protein [Occallatibacter riparius]UWZ81995.1 SH3 domain-containing protein [Occallatibacter riparius]